MFVSVLFCNNADAAIKPLVADVSQNVIEITPTFTGTSILLFGSATQEGDIYIVFRGPEKNYVINKKEKIAGIWVNAHKKEYQSFPSLIHTFSSTFYHQIPVNYTRELKIPDILHSVENPEQIDLFDAAFISNRAEKKLLFDSLQRVTILGETLFKTRLTFPATVGQGMYTAEIYLFDADNRIMAAEYIPIEVKKIGIDSAIYDLSQNNQRTYGIIAIILAIFGGWLASYLFLKFNL